MKRDSKADRDFILKLFREYGKNIVDTFEAKASSMAPDELIEHANFYPDFNPDRQYLYFSPGFVCVSPSGNVVKLLQPYDSIIYQQQPEDLPAQWGFVWPTNPKYAKPFIAISTSPYMDGDCCTFEGRVYRSEMNNNVWPPGTVGISWTDLGPIEDVQI